jgi:hypothetical protein
MFDVGSDWIFFQLFIEKLTLYCHVVVRRDPEHVIPGGTYLFLYGLWLFEFKLQRNVATPQK